MAAKGLNERDKKRTWWTQRKRECRERWGARGKFTPVEVVCQNTETRGIFAPVNRAARRAARSCRPCRHFVTLSAMQEAAVKHVYIFMQVGQAAPRRESLAERCIGCFRANLICPSSRIQTRLSRTTPALSLCVGWWLHFQRLPRDREWIIARYVGPGWSSSVVFAVQTEFLRTFLRKTHNCASIRKESEYIFAHRIVYF